jgi:flagellar basal body-associated protein FliL
MADKGTAKPDLTKSSYTPIIIAVVVLIAVVLTYWVFMRKPKKNKEASKEADVEGFDVAAEVEKLRKMQDMYKAT